MKLISWIGVVVLATVAVSARAHAQSMAADAGVSLDASLFMETLAADDAGKVGPVSPPRDDAPVDITTRGRNEARRLQQSAEAVTVISAKKARIQTADLGEVLARTQGVSVRREGGLGSNALLALAGLQGEQIRQTVDAIPLPIAGFPFGIANIPLGVVERLEVYRGVVPVRFGADSLGGLINVVTDNASTNTVQGSYQIGSFGIRRASLNGSYRHPRGWMVRAYGHDDVARNNFVMSNRQLWQDDGSSISRDVRRWHDAYRAYGGGVEAGIVDTRWAKRLTVQPFAATYSKQYQHNALMTTPFGGIHGGETIYGATARYEVDLPRANALQVIANYSYRLISFKDLSTYAYDWTGQPSRPVGRNGARGELGMPYDDMTHEQAVFGRISYSYVPVAHHSLRLSVTPRYATRYLDDRVEGNANPRLDQSSLQLVGGGEYEAELFDGRLDNILFGKAYYLRAQQEVLSSALTGRQKLDPLSTRRVWGIGDSLRFRFARGIMAKASYEYATRLPTNDELFGNGALVIPNVNLRPERSHNINVGPRIELSRSRIGELSLDLNLFHRGVKDLILLLPSDTRMPYRNVSDVRSRGVEAWLSWTSLGRWVSVDGSYTLQDIRNTSAKGQLGIFKGMRIPAQPWKFASWSARVRIPGLPGDNDVLEPFYYGRYTHRFDRGWAIGLADTKMSVPSQINHDLGVTYARDWGEGRLGCTFEIDNLADARLYDYFGVQRPGRSYNLKVFGEL